MGENEPIPTSVLDMAMDLLALALGGNANEESKVSLEARRGDENKQRDGSSLVDTDIQTLVGPLPEHRAGGRRRAQHSDHQRDVDGNEGGEANGRKHNVAGVRVHACILEGGRSEQSGAQSQ